MSTNQSHRRFTSEHLLQQAIASLLTRIPGVTDVQILQGAQEYGKDIVFRSTGPLNELLYCACVIKNQRLSGKVGTRGSLRAVFDQIEQALDTPFVDASGEQRRIHHVYVMSPEDVSPASMNAIAGKLTSRSGQVIFKCGTALYEMFMRHWPEFLADEKAILASYEARLEEAGRGTAALAVLAIEHALGPLPDTIGQIYVQPSFHRVINCYNLMWPADATTSTPESIAPKWTKDQVIRKANALEAEIQLFVHCASWPMPGWKYDGELTHVQQLTSSLLDRLKGLLLSAAQQRVSKKIKLFRQIPEEFVAYVPNNLLNNLRNEAAQLHTELLMLRGLLEEQLAEFVGVVSQYHPNTLTLDDLVFYDLCRFDDCFRAYAGSLIKTHSPRRFDLGKGVHHRYAGPLVIEGGPGSGKTSFCRWNALADASGLMGGMEFVMPVYVPLHEFANTEPRTFEEVFLSRVGRSVLIPDRLATRSDLKKRFYLDGLDEVADLSYRTKLMSLAQVGFAAMQQFQVIITVRDYLRERSLNWAQRVTISGLDVEEMRKLARMAFDGDDTKTTTFMQQVSSSESLSAVAQVPLLATVMILVFKRIGRVPENRARLYTVFVRLLCGGWDLAKGVVRTSRYAVDMKLRVLNAVGGQLHRERKKEFDENWFGRASRLVLVHDHVAIESLLAEILKDGILTRTGDTYEFAHLSFQEFFAAGEMLGDPAVAARQAALRQYLDGEQWWREVLIFYIGLSQNAQAITKWLSEAARQPIGKGRAQLKVLLDAVRLEFPEYAAELVAGTGDYDESR